MAANKSATTDETFIAAWEKAGGSPAIVCQLLGVSTRAVYMRRAVLANKGIILKSNPIRSGQGSQHGWQTDVGRAYKRQNDLWLENGVIVVFSDAHFWPNEDQTIANMALLELIKDLKPAVICANGDIFDGASVSRHPPIGWSKLPSVKEELEICDERLHEIVLAAPGTRPQLFWNVGNHDARLDRTLCTVAPGFEGTIMRLEDRFPAWNMAWSLNVNENTMIKHRYHNGVHATYNNTMKSGRSIVTGHLHRLAVTPWADYNGHRWGVDTGTLSEPHGPQFDYAENNPSPHTSGFAVLTFRNGELLPPELCCVIKNVAYFRGQAVIDGN
jgi:hypothetical protein